MTEPRKPLKFEIPDNAARGWCSGCSAPVAWIITTKGKRMPVDPDGTSHFATCIHADKFRKKK